MINISDARAIAKRRDCQAVVVISVGRDGTISTVSYGEDKGKCDAIGEWTRSLWPAVFSIIPFQTVFGWGCNGLPTPVTEEQIANGGGPAHPQTPARNDLAVQPSSVMPCNEGTETSRGSQET